MPRKGENIYKRKDGRWEGRYIKGRIDGRAVYGYVYAKTYRDTKAKLASCRSSSVKKDSLQSKNFQDIALQWICALEPQVKISTLVKYRSILEKHLFPSFGNIPVAEITNAQIDSLCTKLLQSGQNDRKGLSPKTVTDILSVFRAVLKYAVRTGQSLNCSSDLISVRQSSHRIRFFSMDEQLALVGYLNQHPGNYSLGILMSLFTGLRIGEICALRWEDLSFHEGTFKVQRTIQRVQIPSPTGAKTTIIIAPPKSVCSIRTIPLPELLRPQLLQYQKETGFFLSNRNGLAIEPRVMQYHFKKVLKECDIQNASFHTLRHTFATRCIEVGFDVKSLSEILGHASVTITMNRYVHPSMDLKKQNMQRLSQLFAVK